MTKCGHGSAHPTSRFMAATDGLPIQATGFSRKRIAWLFESNCGHCPAHSGSRRICFQTEPDCKSATCSHDPDEGNYWFTNSRMLKYQAMMCENPRISLGLCSTLNPATLLQVSTDPPMHNCFKRMHEVYARRPDMKDVLWPSADITYYTDGSCFLHEGKRKAGYSVVTD